MEKQGTAKIQPREREASPFVLEHTAPDVGPTAIHDVWCMIERYIEITSGGVPLSGGEVNPSIADQIMEIRLSANRTSD
jgi:hypothetical protein